MWMLLLHVLVQLNEAVNKLLVIWFAVDHYVLHQYALQKLLTLEALSHLRVDQLDFLLVHNL